VRFVEVPEAHELPAALDDRLHPADSGRPLRVARQRRRRRLARDEIPPGGEQHEVTLRRLGVAPMAGDERGVMRHHGRVHRAREIRAERRRRGRREQDRDAQ
jgi:hypothetical protein